jgi:hypothetical protein
LGVVPFEPNDVAWVQGIETPFGLAQVARRVEVHSLERSDQLFELALADPAVDAALELLEPCLDGQTTAAIAGAWAAIESLLTGPGDRGSVAAADRLARIVACSFPRRELTPLAWEHKRSTNDALAGQVAASTTAVALGRAEHGRQRVRCSSSAATKGCRTIPSKSGDDGSEGLPGS